MVVNCIRDDGFPDSGLRIPMPSIQVKDYSKMQHIAVFFDPHKIGHLVAYDEFRKTGQWPHGFTDGLWMPELWERELINKLADAWVGHAMEVGGLKAKLHQAKVRLMNLGDHRPEVETAVAVMGEVEHTLLA